MHLRHIFTKLQSAAHQVSFTLARRKIVLFVAKNQCYVVAFSGSQVLERKYYPSDDHKAIRAFLKKYNKHALYILWGKGVNVVHESLPIMNSIRQVNPVDKYIGEKFVGVEYFTSHVVYDIHSSSPEIWELVLINAALDDEWRKTIVVALNAGLSLSGVYLTPSVIPSVINKIALLQGHELTEGNVKVFIVYSATSGLAVYVIQGKNILYVKDVDYPKDASEEYLRGIIENEAADTLIYLNNYLGKGNDIAKDIILLLPGGMAERCSKSDFKFSNQYIIYGDEIKDTLDESETIDFAICNSFKTSPQNASYHEGLSRLSNIRYIGNIIAWPLILIIAVLVLAVGQIVLNERALRQELQVVNDRFNKDAEDFRRLKAKFPTVQHLNRLADFMEVVNRQSQLHSDPVLLLSALEYLTSMEGMYIDYFGWKEFEGNLSNQAEILVRYVADGNDVDHAVTQYKVMIQGMNSIVPAGYYIENTVDRYNSFSRAGRTIIHAKLRILQKAEVKLGSIKGAIFQGYRS